VGPIISALPHIGRFIKGEISEDTNILFRELNYSLQQVPGFAKSKAIVVPLGSSIGAWAIRAAIGKDKPYINDQDWGIIYDSEVMVGETSLFRSAVHSVGVKIMRNQNIKSCPSVNPEQVYFETGQAGFLAQNIGSQMIKYKKLVRKYGTHTLVTDEYMHKLFVAAHLPYVANAPYAVNKMNMAIEAIYRDAEAVEIINFLRKDLTNYYEGKAKPTHLCDGEEQIKVRHYLLAHYLNILRIAFNYRQPLPINNWLVD